MSSAPISAKTSAQDSRVLRYSGRSIGGMALVTAESLSSKANVAQRDDNVRRFAPDAAQYLAGIPSRLVKVLVESLEHALTIAKKPPGWPITTGPDAELSGLDAEQIARATWMGDGWSIPPGTIATAASTRSSRLPSADVVIWAGTAAAARAN